MYMKKFSAIPLLLAAVLVLSSCDDKSSTNNQQQQQSSSSSVPSASTATAPEEIAIDVAHELDTNYYVVFDGSGSMADSPCSGGARDGRIVPAKTGIMEFVKKVPDNTNLGLFIFDRRGAKEWVPLGQGPQNRAAFTDAIMNTSPDHGTPLGQAISIAADQLMKQSAKQNGYGEYHILIVTDGEANDEDPRYKPLDKVVDRIVSMPNIVIETIGFCIPSGHALNRPGQTVYYDAMNLDQLRTGLNKILAESESFTGQKK